MIDFKAPVRDIRFVRHELLDLNSHYRSLPGCEELTDDLANAIIEEGAKFCENVIAPLNQSGDEEGCRWEDGVVSTPTGFKEAYQQYVEGGWCALGEDEEYGGQGLPESLRLVMTEMAGTANWGLGHVSRAFTRLPLYHCRAWYRRAKTDLSDQISIRQLDGYYVSNRTSLWYRPGHAQNQSRASGRRQLSCDGHQDIYLRG